MATQFNMMNMLGTGYYMNSGMGYGCYNYGGGYCGNIFSALFSGVNTYANYNYNYGSYCGMNFGRMAGWGIATVLTGYAASVVGGLIRAKVADAAVNGKDALTAKVEDCNTKINAQLEKLGVASEEEVNNLNVEEKYTEAITKAETELNAAKIQVEGLPDVTKQIEDNKTALVAQQAIVDNPNSTPEAKAAAHDNIQSIKTKNATLEQQQRELRQLENDIKEPNGKLYKAHQDAIKAKDAREKAINDAKAEITSLAGERDEAQAKLDKIAAEEQEKADKRILEKGDGTTLNRRTEKNKRYEIDETGVKKTGEEFEDKDWRNLINDYKKGSPKQKGQIKDYINSNWDSIKDAYDESSSIGQALKLIKEKEISEMQ